MHDAIGSSDRGTLGRWGVLIRLLLCLRADPQLSATLNGLVGGSEAYPQRCNTKVADAVESYFFSHGRTNATTASGPVISGTFVAAFQKRVKALGLAIPATWLPIERQAVLPRRAEREGCGGRFLVAVIYFVKHAAQLALPQAAGPAAAPMLALRLRNLDPFRVTNHPANDRLRFAGDLVGGRHAGARYVDVRAFTQLLGKRKQYADPRRLDHDLLEALQCVVNGKRQRDSPWSAHTAELPAANDDAELPAANDDGDGGGGTRQRVYSLNAPSFAALDAAVTAAAGQGAGSVAAVCATLTSLPAALARWELVHDALREWRSGVCFSDICQEAKAACATKHLALVRRARGLVLAPEAFAAPDQAEVDRADRFLSHYTNECVNDRRYGRQLLHNAVNSFAAGRNVGPDPDDPNWSGRYDAFRARGRSLTRDERDSREAKIILAYQHLVRMLATHARFAFRQPPPDPASLLAES